MRTLMRWLGDSLLGVVLVVVFIVLYAPIITVALFSVVGVSRGRPVWSEISLQWYDRLAQNDEIMRALVSSVVVGLSAVVIALAVSWLAALYTNERSNRGRQVLELIIYLPFLLPPIITGLSLLVFFREVGIDRGLAAVVIGHAAFLLALAYRLILVRLQALPRGLIEASYDLGASSWQTFRHVLWPHMRSAFLVAGLLTFVLSFDETLITIFLIGNEMTLPIRVWAMMRVGFTPEINALVTVILIVSTLLSIAVATLLRRRGGSLMGD